MSKVRLLSKEYVGEDLGDLQRDLHEVFDARFTPNIDKCETDEHGIHKGRFRVSVTWCSEDDCDCTGFQHHPSCQHATPLSEIF